jgi:hypothetical protein
MEARASSDLSFIGIDVVSDGDFLNEKLRTNWDVKHLFYNNMTTS